MISKSSRLPLLAGLLCLLLLGFAATSNAAVRFDVVPSPTEVINTGRSEVTGSVNLIVRGTGNVTGTSTGGDVQIGLIYANPAMQIDNGLGSGIRIFFSTGFIPANPSIFDVANRDINGRLSGFITINLMPGATPSEGDFIRIEGVRGRISSSQALTPGTDLFVDLQSINDPAANSFTPDVVRVAKSLDGMSIDIDSDALLLCFPSEGKPPGQSTDYNIQIREGFARAFVDEDSNNDGVFGGGTDRVDSGGYTTESGSPPFSGNMVSPISLGDPLTSTQFLIMLEGIPSSVASISWPSTEIGNAGFSRLELATDSFDSVSGTASAIYVYETTNQTGLSDITFETFDIDPTINLKTTNQTATGQILAAVTLHPTSGRPDFDQMFESDTIATNNPPDDPFKLYASVIRCNCFLLFTYVTADAGWNTGIVVANTTGDTAVFGSSNEAPDQLGKITFYFYDKAAGYVGSTTTAADVLSGNSFVDLVSNMLPTGVTAFSGYIMAKAEFQFCHGFAFIADEAFGSIAHGYIAAVIPDPAIKTSSGVRTAASAGNDSLTPIPAGEGLNN
jgi:hypothetical protein